MNYRTWVHIHLGVLSPIFLYPCTHCYEMSYLHSFIVHILSKCLHALPGSMAVLRLLLLPSIVLCSTHMQALCAIVHFVQMKHELVHVQVVPSACTILRLLLQPLFHPIPSGPHQNLVIEKINPNPFFI